MAADVLQVRTKAASPPHVAKARICAWVQSIQCAASAGEGDEDTSSEWTQTRRPSSIRTRE